MRTFTRNGLEKLMRKAVLLTIIFTTLTRIINLPTPFIPTERLPKVGELSKNLRNFDADRMLLFDEKNAFDMVIREGIFPMYSNSYLVMTGPAPDTVYTKFSNDRADIYAIRTDIVEQEKRRVVRKIPDSPAAAEHVENIAKFYKELKKRYEGSGLFINECHLIKDGKGLPEVQLEYLEGCTLEEMMDDCLDREDMNCFRSLFGAYLDKIRYRAQVPGIGL